MPQHRGPAGKAPLPGCRRYNIHADKRFPFIFEL